MSHTMEIMQLTLQKLLCKLPVYRKIKVNIWRHWNTQISRSTFLI